MSWLPPSDGWLSITDTVALSYEIGWLRHRRIFNYIINWYFRPIIKLNPAINCIDLLQPAGLCRIRPAGFLRIRDEKSHRDGGVFFKMLAEKLQLLVQCCSGRV